MHARAAYFLGDDTAKIMGRLTLNPIPHIDPFMTVLLPAMLVFINSPFIFGAAKPVPINPLNFRDYKWGHALVGISGPLANLSLAFLFGAMYQLLPAGVNPMGESLLLFLVQINVILAVFNLLPVPPLDGSRILYSLLPQKGREVLDQIERQGMLVLFFLIIFLLPVIWGIIGPIIQFLINLAT